MILLLFILLGFIVGVIAGVLIALIRRHNRLVNRFVLLESSVKIQEDTIDELYNEVFPDYCDCSECVLARFEMLLQDKTTKKVVKKPLTKKSK